MSALAGLPGVTRSPVDFFESAILVDTDGNRDALGPALLTVDAFYEWLDRERAAFGASLSLADAIDRFLADRLPRIRAIASWPIGSSVPW